MFKNLRNVTLYAGVIIRESTVKIGRCLKINIRCTCAASGGQKLVGHCRGQPKPPKTKAEGQYPQYGQIVIGVVTDIAVAQLFNVQHPQNIDLRFSWIWLDDRNSE